MHDAEKVVLHDLQHKSLLTLKIHMTLKIFISITMESRNYNFTTNCNWTMQKAVYGEKKKKKKRIRKYVTKAWEGLIPFTLWSYVARSRIIRAAASPFNGSDGLGYRRSCGRNTSKTLTRSGNKFNKENKYLWDSEGSSSTHKHRRILRMTRIYNRSSA